MCDIIEQRPRDAGIVDELVRLSLGARGTDSPAARMRAGTGPVAALSFVLLDRDRVIGTLRFWPVTIAPDAKALQLGPLAIHPDYRGRGLSRRLIRHGLERARGLGHRIVVLIGDPSIYRHHGFRPALPLGLDLPGSEDRERLQVLALAAGALDGVRGTVRPDTSPAPAPER